MTPISGVMGRSRDSLRHRAYTPLVPGRHGETLLNMMFFIERFTLKRAWSDLREDEFFWEPGPNCWSVRRRDECCTPNAFGGGEWVADFDGSVIRASMEGKGVEPLTTIAWLFWHVGSMPGRATDLDFLGGTKSAESGWTAPYMSEHPVFSAPAEAINAIRAGWRELGQAIRGRLTKDLIRPHGSGATPMIPDHQSSATRSSSASSMRSATTPPRSARCAISTGRWTVGVSVSRSLQVRIDVSHRSGVRG